MIGSRTWRLLGIPLRHALQDAPPGALPILLAARSAELGLSNAQIGLAVTSYFAVSALFQPVFGYISDRWPISWLCTVATLWTGALIGVVGWAGTYPLVVLLVGSAGLGSAAYHPLAAAEAAAAGGTHRQATMTSVFVLGGSSGMALLGSALGGAAIAMWGPRGLLLLTGVIWVSTPALHWLTRPRGSQVEETPGQELSAAETSGESGRALIWAGISALVIAVALRGTTYQAFSSYIPKLYDGWGYSPAYYGMLISLFLLSDAVGGVLGSHLADRVGVRLVLVTSLLATTFPLLGFLLVRGGWVYPLLACAGLFHGPSHTLLVVTGQRLLPRRAALASGLLLGLNFVSGSLLSWAAGGMADRWGLHPVLQGVALLPAVNAVASLAALSVLKRPLKARCLDTQV